MVELINNCKESRRRSVCDAVYRNSIYPRICDRVSKDTRAGCGYALRVGGERSKLVKIELYKFGKHSGGFLHQRKPDICCQVSRRTY